MLKINEDRCNHSDYRMRDSQAIWRNGRVFDQIHELLCKPTTPSTISAVLPIFSAVTGSLK